MFDSLAKHHITLAYKLVVAGMALSAMNSILGRLGLPAKPIEQKDLIGAFVLPWEPGRQNQDVKPMLPAATFETTNFAFVFREGKLLLVVNTQTNGEQMDHYREWAKMHSLVDSNEAYHMATNWLARVYVDVPLLNQKYKVSVGQPHVWMTPPAKWGEEGRNLTAVPLYYVTWSKGDYEAARVGIFGPTKQFTGLIIGDRDKGFDASICSHVYLRVTNEAELLAMTNLPMRMEVTNQDLLRRLRPRPPPQPENLGPR
jgi:hypothetical protein